MARYKQYDYESSVQSVYENGTHHYVYLNLNDACVAADSSIPPYSYISGADLTVYADSSTGSNDAAFSVSLTNSNGSTTYLSNFISGTQDGNGSSITDYTTFYYNASSWFHSENASAGHINGYGGTGTYLQCHFNLYVFTKYTFASKYFIRFIYYTPDVEVTILKNGEGTVTGEGDYEYGETYTITAEPNAGYKFVKWSDGDTNASRTFTVDDSIINAFHTKKSYTAIFALESFTITFKNEDGTILQSTDWEYGSTPSYNGTPTKPSDIYYTYEFSDWSPTITTVTGPATYTAQFKSIERKYTITIDPNGGIYNNSSANTTISEKYQSIININNPQKENNFFTHWSLSGTTPLKMIQTANGYTDYSGTNTSTNFSYSLSQDGTYTNYRWYDLNATADAWNYLSFNTYSVAENETITITGYIRINGTSPVRLCFYHGEKFNDYNNNKLRLTSTDNDWLKFSISRTFSTAVDTAIFQIFTDTLKNITGEINFDLKEIKIIRENGTILPTIIENGAGNLNLIAQYRLPIMKFNSVRIYYPTGEELVSPNNPLLSNKEAQIIVQIALE